MALAHCLGRPCDAGIVLGFSLGSRAPPVRRAHEAARLYRRPRHRRTRHSAVAARRAWPAAAGPRSPGRRAVRFRQRRRRTAAPGRVRRRACASGLEPAQPHQRHPLGRWRQRAHARHHEGGSRGRARRCLRQSSHHDARAATAHLDRADRVRAERRPGSRRLGDEACAAGRPRHRIHAVRGHHQYEVSATAEGRRARHQACGHRRCIPPASSRPAAG